MAGTSSWMMDGLAIAGYRSFGAELQSLGPLGKINLLAGQNNSGKSNVLRFAHRRLPELVPGQSRRSRGDANALDAHRPDEPPLRFALATRVGGDAFEELRAALPDNAGVRESFERILTSVADESDLVWWPFITRAQQDQPVVDTAMFSDPSRAAPNDWARVGMAVSQLASGNRVEAYIQAFADWVSRRLAVPRTVLVPAVRQIGASAVESDGDLTGADLIHRLAELQNPSILEQHKKQQFAAINEFVKSVTGDSSAEIEIPNQRDTVHVRLGQHVLPLDNLGTGVHEVTMLAAWATVFERCLMCLEEPEIHLHPLLQRKLLRYLAHRTNNQYLITTHSAHFLDEPGATVFHVRWDGEQTSVTPALAPSARVALCSDLGYRPSDLLQANAVIWVEGPSDRLYVRHWLRVLDPELLEGVHYSIMFYGGRLLSHLSAADVEVEDFIALRRINQWLAIVIDSDRSRKGARLNATKRRVADEFESGPGLAWVTAGREVENYVPSDALVASVSQVHPLATWYEPQDLRYGDMCQVRRGTKVASIDKVKVAHVATDASLDLSILDLRQRTRSLSGFVRRANGMPHK